MLLRLIRHSHQHISRLATAPLHPSSLRSLFSALAMSAATRTALAPAAPHATPAAPAPASPTSHPTPGAPTPIPITATAGKELPLAVDSAAPNIRPGSSDLFLLKDLVGTWVGSGFTLISLPAFSNVSGHAPELFRLKLNRTMETLTFSPIGGLVPNRGAVTTKDPVTATTTGVTITGGQSDTQLSGVSYLQRVSDAQSNAALHVETGFWLNVPPSGTQPAWTVARAATIPHGNSVLATGVAFTAPAPGINPLLSAAPTMIADGSPINAKLMGPFNDVQTPTADYLPAYVMHPNLALQNAINGSDFIDTVVLVVSTADMTTQLGAAHTIPVNNPAPAGLRDPNISNVPKALSSITVPPAGVTGAAAAVGGISNIPFVQVNANASRMDAIFWIETIRQVDAVTGDVSELKQLQYTQTVNLQFNGINWPHITVATLVKQ